MKKILKVVKREFLTKVITKGFLIGTILGPVFLIGIAFGPAYLMSLSSDEPMSIRVVDHTGSFIDDLRQEFSDTLENGQPRFVFSEVQPENYERNEQQFRQDVEKELIDAILIIPSEVMQGEPVQYMAKSVSDIDLIQKLKNGISDIVNTRRLNAAGFDPEKVKELTKKVNIQTIKVVKGEARERGFDQEYVTSMVFLLILYMTLIVYGNSMMQSVIEEKTSRIIEILLSSTNSFQLMIGKLLGVGSVGLVQYIIWAGMALGVFFITTTSMPAISDYIYISPLVLLYFVLFFIIGFFTFSTLYLAVGAMCSDMQDTRSLSTPVTLLVVLPFIVSFMVIKDPTTETAQILSYIPFFTPLIMFLRISLVMPPAGEIILAIGINILGVLLITWVAARIFRIGILMYGKRPAVPEILKWIRYS